MPIIDDRAFRASLLRILKRESTDKRARGGHHDDWSVATAKYYAPCIEEANRRLKALRDHHVADRIKPALQKKQRRSLLGALGARLEFFAWSYHLALAAANYNVLPNPTVDQVARLNDPAHPHTHYNTMTGQALKTITDQFINYLTDVVNHVDTDWNRIKDVFFRNWDLVELLEIGMTGSDTHKGGKQVLILEFKGRRPPAAQITAANYIQNRQVFRPTKRLKLVYKPSDLTLDYLMVGNTQRVKAAHPPGIPPGDSLFELINTLIINHGMNADPTFTGANRPATIQLPTYPILPRVSGAANIATAYGYIKFLKSRPKPEVNLQNISFPPHPADWDWVTDSTDDLIDYYRLYGWYIAIALNFGIADAHNQNLIVHKKKPYLIDLEISFKQRNKTLGHTGFGDAMTRDLGQLGQGSDKNHFFYKHGATLSWTTGTQAATYINAGITEACDLLANDPGGHIENWLTTSLPGVLVRYTPRQTRFYGTELRGIHASSLQPAPNLTTVPKGHSLLILGVTTGI